VSVFGQIPIALILAYIMYRRMVKGASFFQSIVFLPQFLSTIVIGLLWRRFFTADGPISRLIQLVTGDPSAQFTLMLEAKTIMYPIGFVLIWMYTGFYMVVFLANLQKMESTVLEAAAIDGASEFQIFSRIIIPHLMGTIVVCSILAIAGSLRGFDLIFSMTTQGIQRNNAMVLPIFMYITAFQDYANEMRFAYGAAISNAIVLISVGLILFSNFIGNLFQSKED
ncbi:MAG: sugar ABC transporter permease, partial [Spirochaetes bacterium]|nr:sugar ABC transporter permease [Spirochaetota bacterium]